MLPRVDPSALYRSLVDTADDAISSTDLQERVTSWNRAAEQLYGDTAAEMIGGTNRIIIPEDRGAEEDAILTRVGDGQSVRHIETERVRKDGTRVHVAISASPIRDDAGQVI